jgi:hypothetical protein
VIAALQLSPTHVSGYVNRMRVMAIRGFPGSKMKLTDLGWLIKVRVTKDLVHWPDQGLPLVGYMAWPNAAEARERWLNAHRCDDRGAIDALAKKLKIVQQHWARVADVVHLHYDLTQGHHQQRRGGASVGKAIALIDANARSKGTGAAKLWEIWKRYKDAAHLITAAILVSAEVQTRNRQEPYGMRLHQFQPYRMALLMPELVISVALTIEKYGLEFIARGRAEPLFDPETLWRVPTDINVAPISFPVRRITTTDVVALNARRAGNRGQANRRKTTPISA